MSSLYETYPILKYGDPLVTSRNVEYYGTDTTPKKNYEQISYSFNNFGFRDKDFTKNVDAIALGCSVTLGEGLNYLDTWKEKLQEYTGLSLHNLGVSGASCETCARLCEYWVQVLKPKYIFWLIPSLYRIELYNSNLEKPVVIMPNIYHGQTKFYKEWTKAEVNPLLKYKLALNTIEYVCKENNIILYKFMREDVEFLDLARDQMHPGKNTHKVIADLFYSMYTKDRNG